MTTLCTDKHTKFLNIIDYSNSSQGVGRMVPVALARAAPDLLSVLRRMHDIAVQCAPITAYGDGSAFDEYNKILALLNSKD